MDAEALIGSLARGILTGGSRRKSGRRASSFLAGGTGSFLNSSTLLTVAGLAWGLYESARPKTTVPGSPVPVGSAGVPPPLSPDLRADQVPPLPAGPSPVDPGLLRLVRLTISAARADGTLSQAETDEILAIARRAGAEDLVRQELQRSAPLAEITSGVDAPRTREELYAYAFAIVHADEGISGAERIYLAQLAGELGLDDSTIARLEADVEAGIGRTGPSR